MPKSPYAGKWAAVRLSILDRDGWLCQIRGPGCTTKATCVDHIVATEDGGAWWDSSNLRASCFACNNNRRGSYGGRRWRTVATVITLVTGPQTQTSAYLASHAQPDDVIADHASQPPATYDALIAALRTGKVSAARAWITAPGQTLTLPHHHHVDLGGHAGGAFRAADRHTMTDPASHTTTSPSRRW